VVFTGHIVGVGVLALPDDNAAPWRQPHAQATALRDVDRMTLFVELDPLPSPPQPPPLPPMPLPERLRVPSLVKAPARTPPAAVVVATELPAPVSLQTVLPPATTSPQASTEDKAAVAEQSVHGATEQIRSDRAAYMRALMAALLQHRSYPPEARKQRARGTVHVRFSLNREGHVLAASIARGAGFEILETAALQVLRSADPLPPIPDSLGVDRLTVTVPIEYSLITR